MVTDNINKGLHAVEAVEDRTEALASDASGEKKSQEEIKAKKMEQDARKLIHGSLKIASSLEKEWGNLHGKTEDIVI